MPRSVKFNEEMQDVAYIEVDGMVYVSVTDVIRCVDHIEREIVEKKQTVTIGDMLRWLRKNLMQLLK